MSSGNIQTVTGLIAPKDVGATMAHEHLTIEFDVAHLPTQDKEMENSGYSLENLGWIRQNPLSHHVNMKIGPDEEYNAIVEEMKYYKASGGSTIVDNTTLGIGRDVNFLKKISKASGVNIIAGAGYYVDAAHPSDMSSRSEESLVEQMELELTHGCDGTDIKAGVIGEIGCSWPLTANEKKMLRATAAAQSTSGCPVIIHPGRNEKAPAEILRILQEAGGDVGKTVMSHLDRTIADKDALLEFAALGSYCEWDLFGLEVSHYGPNLDYDMPSDAQRIERIRWLFEEGYGNRVTVGHDVHTKHRLMKYGGHGFSHILLNVVPKMLVRGFNQEQVDQILVKNPTEWLTFK